jgi:hypothetical protein
MSVAELQEISGFVQRRIVRGWRDDIKIVDVTTRRRGLVRRKQTLVEIGCRSRIACEQARLSLAEFAANHPDDWEVSHWDIVDGAELPFRMRLVEPGPDVSDD